MLVADLDIIYWAASLGGEHYTGYLCYNKNGNRDEYTRHELQYPLSTSQAKYLNKKDKFRGYEKGMLSNRFFTIEELYKYAIEHAKENNIDVVVKDGSSIQPGPVIYCKHDEIREELEMISERAAEMYEQSYDPWATFGKEADDLWEMWENILKG